MIGLAVMGQNLALNMADHGFKVAVFNRTTSVMHDFVKRNPSTPGGLVACETVEQMVAAIKRPRKFIVLVKAGPAVDAVTRQLIEAGIDEHDIVVDCGNSLWTDTIRREKAYASRCKFFGSGVSGGEVGARFGPSLMPGGDPSSWQHLKPMILGAIMEHYMMVRLRAALLLPLLAFIIPSHSFAAEGENRGRPITSGIGVRERRQEMTRAPESGVSPAAARARSPSSWRWSIATPMSRARPGRSWRASRPSRRTGCSRGPAARSS